MAARIDRLRQLGRELALLLDALQHGGAPVLQLAQVAEALLQLAELRVVEAARLLLAVAGDERHGRAFAEQLHGRRQPVRRRRQAPAAMR